MAKSDQWQLQILAPTSAEGPQKGLAGSFGSHEINVPANQVRAQWKQTIDGLMSFASDWSAGQADGWHVAELKIGMTISAKGQLLFIAEAGATASVEIRLTRGGGAQPSKESGK